MNTGFSQHRTPQLSLSIGIGLHYKIITASFEIRKNIIGFRTETEKKYD
jgi:hypothetical protein